MTMATPVWALEPQDEPCDAAFRRQEAGPARTTAVAGPLARPERIVAGWLVAVVLVVAGSTAYLSLLVHMAIMGRQVARLQAELAMERRRGEALEVALARETSPAHTERMARTVLAMERPNRVRVLVLDGPPAAGVAVASRPAAEAMPTRDAPGWAERLGATLVALLHKPVALARQLPSWP